MMTKIAHMRENRKANKGFSLVELIIVMAIMVALVAVLAPQYIRYLQRSRDAVVKNAAEDVLTAVKTDIIDPDGELKIDSTTASVVVNAAKNGSKLIITPNGLSAKSAGGSAGEIISKLAGISDKQVKSEVKVTINIKQASDGTYMFSSSEGKLAST